MKQAFSQYSLLWEIAHKQNLLLRRFNGFFFDTLYSCLLRLYLTNMISKNIAKHNKNSSPHVSESLPHSKKTHRKNEQTNPYFQIVDTFGSSWVQFTQNKKYLLEAPQKEIE